MFLPITDMHAVSTMISIFEQFLKFEMSFTMFKMRFLLEIIFVEFVEYFLEQLWNKMSEYKKDIWQIPFSILILLNMLFDTTLPLSGRNKNRLRINSYNSTDHLNSDFCAKINMFVILFQEKVILELKVSLT
jgi:hypothetical protein